MLQNNGAGCAVLVCTFAAFARPDQLLHTALGLGATNGFDESLALVHSYHFHCCSGGPHCENSWPPWIQQMVDDCLFHSIRKYRRHLDIGLCTLACCKSGARASTRAVNLTPLTIRSLCTLKTMYVWLIKVSEF